MLRFLIVVLVLTAAASLFGVRMIESGLMRPRVAAVRPMPPKPADSRTVVIKSENGSFAADVRVDGRDGIPFMVDTGAMQIAIRESDAARLGYRPGPGDYAIRIETANGEGRAAPIELSSVEVGDIMVRDVRALVVPDNALSVNLLGMSFLSRVRWTQERGQLVLEQ
jgi:aspartyl protease family protein